MQYNIMIIGGGVNSSDCEYEANQGDHIGSSNSLKSYFGTVAKTASRLLPLFVGSNA